LSEAPLIDNLGSTGKQVLTSTRSNGITLSLNNLKIAFAARSGPSTELMELIDGNVVAIDSAGASMSPLSPTAFTQIDRQLDVSAAFISETTIAAKVWDQLRSLHVVSGSFGEGIASVVGNVSGSVASVVGNVGGSVASVTGNVGGSVASVTGNIEGTLAGLEPNTITAAAISTDAIGSFELATDAVQEIVDGIRQQVLTEAYAADGAAPTMEQLLYMIWSALAQFSIAGATLTSRKLDGSTTAMTFGLDDPVNPTSRTRNS